MVSHSLIFSHEVLLKVTVSEKIGEAEDVVGKIVLEIEVLAVVIVVVVESVLVLAVV